MLFYMNTNISTKTNIVFLKISPQQMPYLNSQIHKGMIFQKFFELK